MHGIKCPNNSGIKCPNNRRGAESAKRVKYRRRKTDSGKTPLNNTHGYVDRPTKK